MSEAFLPGDLASFANFRSVQGHNVVEFIDVMRSCERFERR